MNPIQSTPLTTRQTCGLPFRAMGCLLLGLLWTLPVGVYANYFDEIGYTALAAELGPALPSGAGVKISEIEALDQGSYLADPTLEEFSGKVFNDLTGRASGYSFHANAVSRFLFGNTSGVAPGIREVDVYEAVDWYGRMLLRADNGFIGAPLPEHNRVQNHSWVANREEDTPLEMAIKISRLFDYVIARDRLVSVVTLRNEVGSPVPDLLSHNYNAITVGKTSGEHSRGGTRFDGVGRKKPDLVAPFASTSFSAPVVSGTVAMLMEVIDEHSGWAAAARPETMKAILLAGATKEEFTAWSRSPTQPLDARFGAGELNVQNSYHILLGGQQPPNVSTEVERTAWDFGWIAPGATNRYFFSAPEGFLLTDFSAMLVWNRVITDSDVGPAFVADAFLPNHDLLLNHAEGFQPGAPIDTSQSTTENVEHVYVSRLGGGQFVLSVASSTGGEYGLAWRSSTARAARISALEIIDPRNVQISIPVNDRVNIALETIDSPEAGWTPIVQEAATGPEMVLEDRRPPGDLRQYRVAERL